MSIIEHKQKEYKCSGVKEVAVVKGSNSFEECDCKKNRGGEDGGMERVAG